MDIISSNLQAINEKFNNILNKLESVKGEALSNLETTASSATSTLVSELSDVTTRLRALVPEGVSTPNINLQAQLASLSGITDTTQATNLLSSITTNFSSALSSSGFSLDKLVSLATGAVGSGISLSGIIPNFEKAADGLSDAFQKASGVKLPSIDPVTEEVATITENADLTATTTAATNAVITVTETFPTEDTNDLKISEKYKKVTQSHGGTAITKEVTTPIQAVEGTLRKNISSKGFSHRVYTVTEQFSTNKDVILSFDPIKIINVYGKTTKPETVGTKGSYTRFKIIPLGTKSAESNNQDRSRKYKHDLFSINGKKIICAEHYRKYDGTPYAISVTYRYNDTYDPIYMVT
tara:strand:- start:12 stop:1070 length:1059 start_codon:yes stop_codon:yes gene_type:complete